MVLNKNNYQFESKLTKRTFTTLKFIENIETIKETIFKTNYKRFLLQSKLI